MVAPIASLGASGNWLTFRIENKPDIWRLERIWQRKQVAQKEKVAATENMSLEILQAIEKKKAALPTVCGEVIKGKVRPILTNFNQIKGKNFDRAVIYRQKGRDDYHQDSWLEKLFVFYTAASFASPKRGDIVLDEIASWREWRHELDASVLNRRRSFLVIEQETAVLRAMRSEMFYGGEMQECFRLTLRIKANEQEILSLIERNSDGILIGKIYG